MVQTRRSSAASVRADKRPPPSAAMVETQRSSAAPVPAGKRPPPSAASIRGKKRPKVPSFPDPPPVRASDPPTGAFASSAKRISTTPRGRGTAGTDLPGNLRTQISQTTSADASSIAVASILASLSGLENNLAVPLMTSNVKNVQQGRGISSLPSGCDASDNCSPDNNTDFLIGKEYATSEFDLGKDHREIPQNLGSLTLPSPGCQAVNAAVGPGICSTNDTHRSYTMSGDASSNMESSQNMESDKVPSQHVDFNSFGQPILDGSEQFSTYVGQIAKTHCPPTFDSWRDVANAIKEKIWKSVTNEYEIPDAYKKSVLSKARIALRQWKFQLRRHYDKFETDAERKRNIPKRIKKEDWECFVDMCSTEADRTRRKKGKLARQNVKRYHTTGRSGLGRLAEKLKEQDGTTSVTRTRLYLAGHTSKKKKKNKGMEMETENEDDPEIVEIQRMIGNDPSSVFKDLDHDPVALVCGRDRSGHVRGLGTGISKTAFHASAPSREIAQREKCKSESMTDELKTLKISIVQQANEHKILQERLASFEKHVASLMDTRRATLGSPGGSNSEETRLPSTCLVRNLRRKVVAMGRISKEAVLSDETYIIVLDNVYEPQENLYDRDGKFGDVRIGDLITWPKGFVELIGV